MQNIKHLKLLILGIGIAAIGSVYTGSVLASHNFEAGVQGNNLPDNTHVRLDGITLPSGGVLPVYDASPNFVAGHFLLRAPCDEDTHVPTVTVIAGHIDESADFTHMDLVPLYYIAHASPLPGICVYHAHIPDPFNGGSPRVTDIDLVNFRSEPIEFNPGDVVDINIQRVLGSISDASYEGDVKLPLELADNPDNPVFDLNDGNPNNDGLGFHHGGEE
jgi:hypothetical protein